MNYFYLKDNSQQRILLLSEVRYNNYDLLLQITHYTAFDTMDSIIWCGVKVSTNQSIYSFHHIRQYQDVFTCVLLLTSTTIVHIPVNYSSTMDKQCSYSNYLFSDDRQQQ